ncbi:MAG: hypothetical protein EA404_11910 [Spirochaetaceae bacterium]|nr:MAG: hypothetical protein EA404_11910 [Spirochaetaceae bacterium]
MRAVGGSLSNAEGNHQLISVEKGKQSATDAAAVGEFRQVTVEAEATSVDGAIEAAASAAEGCELFLSIGTSALVYPAAMLPHQALEAGATLVEINPEQTPLSAHAHLSIRGSAATVLAAVIE